MIKSISSFSPVFKGIDVYKLRAKNGDEKVVAVLDKDTFERTGLPCESDIENLNGAYGHPYSGRPLINLLEDDDAKEGIIEAIKDFLSPDEIAETIVENVDPEDVADLADNLADTVQEADTSSIGEKVESAIEFLSDIIGLGE